MYNNIHVHKVCIRMCTIYMYIFKKIGIKQENTYTNFVYILIQNLCTRILKTEKKTVKKRTKTKEKLKETKKTKKGKKKRHASSPQRSVAPCGCVAQGEACNHLPNIFFTHPQCIHNHG